MSKRKKEWSRANECATRSVKPARLFYSRTRLHIFMTIETTTMLSYSHAYKKNLLDIFVLSFFPYLRSHLLSHSRVQHLNLHATSAAYVCRLLIHFSARVRAHLLLKKRKHPVLLCPIFPH